MPCQLRYTRHANLLSPFKSLFQGGEWPTPDYRLLFYKKKNPPKPKEKKKKPYSPTTDHRPPTTDQPPLEAGMEHNSGRGRMHSPHRHPVMSGAH